MKKISLLAIVLVVMLTSCGKYEDGPSFTLLSKKSRAVNLWTLDAIIDSEGKDVTSDRIPNISEYTMDIKNDYTYELIITQIGTSSNQVYGDTIEGAWEFSDNGSSGDPFNNMYLVMTPYNNLYGPVAYSKILKLESKALWIIDDNNEDEYHFIEKLD